MNRDQIRTILWLRWQLTRNQWQRSGGLGTVIAALGLIGGILLGGAALVGGCFGAYYGLAAASPDTIMWTWLGVTAFFLFIWMIGLLQELQRSETIDLQRLMHLPVALGQMFVINYLISHLTLSIVLCAPAMLGLIIGLTAARGWTMLLLLPLAAAMLFTVSAWTFCLRGWLAIKMADPRRRRTVIMVITLLTVGLAQLPQLFNLANMHNRHVSGTGHHASAFSSLSDITSTATLVEGLFPPFWLPLGAGRLADHQPGTALLATAGLVGIGFLGLRRAYRSTIRFYHGDTGGKVSEHPVSGGATAADPVKSDIRLMEYRHPWVPEQAMAVATATFRSMLRAPEVKIALGSTFLATLFLGFMFLVRMNLAPTDTYKPFILTGSLTMSVFFMSQFYFNPFGFDRDGFRALVLSPAQRHLILLGKNLACLPFSILFGGTILLLVTARLRPAPDIILAAVFQLLTLLLLSSTLGNLLATVCAHQIKQGSLKPTKLPGQMVVLMLLCQLLSVSVLGLVFLSPLAGLLWQKLNWPDFVPANLLSSMLLFAAAVTLYWQLLRPLGRLLQRRETTVLNTVVAEVE